MRACFAHCKNVCTVIYTICLCVYLRHLVFFWNNKWSLNFEFKSLIVCFNYRKTCIVHTLYMSLHCKCGLILHCCASIIGCFSSQLTYSHTVYKVIKIIYIKVPNAVLHILGFYLIPCSDSGSSHTDKSSRGTSIMKYGLFTLFDQILGTRQRKTEPSAYHRKPLQIGNSNVCLSVYVNFNHRNKINVSLLSYI